MPVTSGFSNNVMSVQHALVLGTHNRKKGRELAELLAPHGFRLLTLADFPDAIEVVEDGESFAANAALKATQQARHLRQWVLGEDSGLAVDALGGAPGIYSARYSGAGATDQANNRYLLSQLSGVPLERRTAHYVCHISLADPRAVVRADCEAYCHGRIRFEEAGSAGFGYDPLFEIVEYHRTFGQLGDAVKSVLRHRARALQVILPQLLELAHGGQWT
jgi:XTP/dITP diphosphohydrolase